MIYEVHASYIYIIGIYYRDPILYYIGDRISDEGRGDVKRSDGSIYGVQGRINGGQKGTWMPGADDATIFFSVRDV